MSINPKQFASTTGGFSTTISQAFGAAVTPGNQLVVVWAASDDAVSVTTCADSVNTGGGYNAKGTVLHDTTKHVLMGAFVLDTTAAGTPTVTITFNTAPNKSAIWICEVDQSGAGFDIALGFTSASPGATTADAIATGSSTPSVQPGLLIAASLNTTMLATNLHSCPAVGTAFSNIGAVWNFGNGDAARFEYKRYTSLASIAGTFTAVSGSQSDNYLTIGLLFKEPGASSAIAGNAVVAAAVSAALSTGIQLAGTPASVTSATGFLMGLMGNASVAAAGSGILTTAIKMAAAAIASASAQATLGAGVSIGGDTIVNTSAAAVLTNWTTVTLTAPLYTGVGSICDPHAWPDNPPPVAGSVIYYDATNITILPDGSITSSVSDCLSFAQFKDGGGVWHSTPILITSGFSGFVDVSAQSAGLLSTAIVLAGAAALLVSATATLNTQVQLVAAVQALNAATGALVNAIQLFANAVSSTSASGTLSGTVNQLAGNASSSVSAAAVLNAQIQLASAASAVVLAAGALSAQILFQAAALSTSSLSGTLITNTQMGSAAQAAVAATGALLTAIRMAGPVTAAIIAAGNLTNHIDLLANVVATTTATGSLTAFTGLAANANALATAIGSLTNLISMRASAFAISNADAQLLTQIPLQGGALVTDSAAGTLTATGAGVGTYPVDPYFVIGVRRQYFTQRFPVIAPGEEHILSFKFADELAANETLEGIPTVNVSVSAGVDGSAPGDLLNGEPAFDPTLTMVEQPIHGAIQDNDYYFTVTSPTTNPYKKLTRYGLLSVRG